MKADELKTQNLHSPSPSHQTLTIPSDFFYIVDNKAGMRKSKQSTQNYLGEFEELVLLAVLRLDKNAYGVSIRREIENKTERSTSVGAVYTTLERLEKKGYVSSWEGEATAERGGRAKRYFQLESVGAEALRQAMLARKRLLRGVNRERLPVRV
jgi:PadR family transcriptional regulator